MLLFHTNFADFIHSVNVFIDRMPAEDRDAYLDDVVQKLIQKSIIPNEHNENENSSTIITSYSLMVAYARK